MSTRVVDEPLYISLIFTTRIRTRGRERRRRSLARPEPLDSTVSRHFTIRIYTKKKRLKKHSTRRIARTTRPDSRLRFAK